MGLDVDPDATLAYFEWPTREQLQIVADLAEGGRPLLDIDDQEVEAAVVSVHDDHVVLTDAHGNRRTVELSRIRAVAW